MQIELFSALEELSPIEVAVFLFSVDGFGNETGDPVHPQMIPTKDAIIWALCAYEFVRQHKLIHSDDIEERFKRIIGNNLYNFVNSQSNFKDRYKRNMSPYPVPLVRYEEIFGFRRGVLKTKSLHLLGSVEKSLQDKGLIIDPFGLEIPGALFISILGLIPYSFSIKTDKGKEKSLKIGAWLWDFSYSKKENDSNFSFKLNIARTVSLIKRHLSIETKRSDDEKIR